MKKRIILIIMLSFVLFISGVRAEVSIINENGGKSSNFSGGTGSWDSYGVGVKVSIVKNDGTLKSTKVIINRKVYDANYDKEAYVKKGKIYFNTVLKPKNQMNNIIWKQTNSIFEVENALPDCWNEDKKDSNGNVIYQKDSNGNFIYNEKGEKKAVRQHINFEAELEKSNFSLLRTILNNHFSNIDSNDYIIIEPMYKINVFFGTLYEFWTSSSSLKFLSTTYDNDVAKNGSNALYYKGKLLQFTQSESQTNVDSIISCIQNQNCSSGLGLYRAIDLGYEPTKGSIEISKKSTSTNALILSSDATFGLYSDSRCETVITTKKTSGGKVTFDNLDPTTYYIKEVTAPSGYTRDTKCYSLSVTNGNVTKTNIFNSPTCQTRFDDELVKSGKEKDPAARINLFQDLGGNSHKNLLDFNNTTTPCGEPNCNIDFSNGCFSASSSARNFNSSNLSCYSEIINIGGTVGYCSVSYNLENYLSSTNFGKVKAGMPIIISSNPRIAQGNISYTCYAYGTKSGTITTDITNAYNYYISSVSFNESDSIEGENPETSNWVPTPTDSYTIYRKTITQNYNLKPIYLNSISGKHVDECSEKNCLFLGYGIMSRITDNNVSGNIPFSITMNRKLIDRKFFAEYITVNSSNCMYSVEKELLDDKADNNNYTKLNLEFRSIKTDLGSAFTDKDGKARSTKTNWCYGTLCNSNNLVVQTIVNRNDSLNKLHTSPLYEITLTPEDIKKIRKYNSKTTYDDYSYDCYDLNDNKTKLCSNRFISNLVNGYIAMDKQKENMKPMSKLIMYNKSSKPDWMINNSIDMIGDVNKDGCLDEIDINLIKNVENIAKTYRLDKNSADVNRDKTVNNSDAVELENIIKTYDENNDGKVNYDDFLKIFVYESTREEFVKKIYNVTK